MRAKDFYANMSRIAPSVAELIDSGYSQSLAESIRDSYIPRLRKKPLHNETSNELVALISSYECAHVRIGLFEFAEYPQRKEDEYILGSYESINQVVAIGDRCEVRFADGQTLPLAQNADALLSVLFEVASVQRNRLFGKEPSAEELEHIVHLAGGGIYSMLITELVS
jgi:hypothetical protein